ISGSTSLAVGSLSSTHRWVLATPDCMAVLAGLKMRTFIGLHSLSAGAWSGRPDLNRRPSAPKADALPDCATPRRKRLMTRGFLRAAEAPRKRKFQCAKVGHVRPDPRGRPARPCAIDQRAGRTAAALLPGPADRVLSRWLLQYRPRGHGPAHGLRRHDRRVPGLLQGTRQRSVHTDARVRLRR